MPFPEHAPKTVKAFGKLIKPLRARARELGYALGVHGTLLRDIDLIAAPWSRDAVSARHLAEALRIEAERVIGFAFDRDASRSNNPHYFNEGSPGHKPHGRRCWTFHLGGGPYIDLSVMPRENEGPMPHCNVFAYTALNPDYPAFVSINKDEKGLISIEVRSAKKPEGAPGNPHPFDICGDQAMVSLPHEELPKLIKALQAEVARGR